MDWFLAAATGRDTSRDALLGQHLTDFVTSIPLIPHHRGHRWQVFEHHIGTGEVTALTLTPVESQVTTFTVTDHMELAGHAPLGATNQAGGTPPLLRLHAVGWALMSVASIISTSGSAESDADNSEKIRSKTPLSHQRRQRL